MTENEQGPATLPSVTLEDQRPLLYQNAVKACDRFIDQYRGKRISKVSAFRQIDSALTKVFSPDHPRLTESSAAYLEILDNHDFHESESVKQVRQSSRSPSANSEEIPAEPLTQRLKLDRETVEVPKILDIDETETPWGLSEAHSSITLLPSLQKTNELIKRYSTNPKGYKHSLINSTNCPEFPDGEWQNVLAGRAVNLDIILGGYFSTSNNDRQIETIGDIEIHHGAAPSKRSVSSVGDWAIAWGFASTAITYAFPNRFDELTSYGRYILGLFASTNPLFHERIISLDRAIRQRVGSTRRLELMDFQSFADLKDSHFESTGTAISIHTPQPSPNQPKASSSSLKSSRKNEACNK
jgi:hypothetical protein